MEDQLHLKDVGVGLSGKPVAGTPTTKASNGLLQIASVEEMESAKKANEEAEAKAASEIDSPPLKTLEQYLASVFENNRAFKEDETDTQAVMIDSLNRRNAKYDSAKLSKIQKAGSSDVFIGLTGVKCRAFESWVHDIYVNAKRKRTWDLKPTPIVSLQPNDEKRIIATVMQKYADSIEQGQEMQPMDAYEMASSMRAEIIKEAYAEAGKKAENMSRKIHDQLIEGGWIKAFSQAVMDISTMKAAIIKGPVIRRRKVRNGWEKKNGMTVPKIMEEEIATFERVSPLNFYPGRANENVDDGPIAEKVHIMRSSLAANRKESNYVTENIEHIILNYSKNPPGQQSSLQQNRDLAEGRDTINQQPTVGPSLEGIEFWCRCPGGTLPDFGITKDANGKDIDPFMDYDINAITIQGKIVYLALNDDALGRRPYSVYGYAKEIGGFWFMSIAELIKSEQDMCNAAARAMVNNLGIASGPQVVIPDTTRMAEGQNITSMYPWKIWQGTNRGNSTAPLVDFFQPSSQSAELLSVLNQAMKMTDSTLEMPSYSYGNDKVAGAGRTASGLSMLMGSSNRGLKRILLGMDRHIFQTVVERQYDWNMQNLPDDSIKGDMNFISEGIVSMIMKEQLSERRMGLLQATNNEFDMKILGLDGRAKILRDAIETLESDYDDIKPSEEKIARLIAEESILQQQTIQKNQIEIEKEQNIMERESQVAMAELQIKQQELELKAQEIALKDKNMSRELDIRSAKNSQGIIEKLMERDEQENESVETK